MLAVLLLLYCAAAAAGSCWYSKDHSSSCTAVPLMDLASYEALPNNTRVIHKAVRNGDLGREAEKISDVARVPSQIMPRFKRKRAHCFTNKTYHRTQCPWRQVRSWRASAEAVSNAQS
jgi:hypothetical protein